MKYFIVYPQTSGQSVEVEKAKLAEFSADPMDKVPYDW